MSEAIQCDQCDKIARPDTATDWLRVEAVSRFIVVHGQQTGPWHLCSWQCLTAWSAGHERPTRTSEGGVTYS